MTENTKRGFWYRFFTELMHIEQRALWGSLLLLAAGIIMIWYGFNE